MDKGSQTASQKADSKPDTSGATNWIQQIIPSLLNLTKCSREIYKISDTAHIRAFQVHYFIKNLIRL